MVRLEESNKFGFEQRMRGVRERSLIPGFGTYSRKEVKIKQTCINPKPVVVPTAHKLEPIISISLNREISKIPIQQNRNFLPFVKRDAFQFHEELVCALSNSCNIGLR